MSDATDIPVVDSPPRRGRLPLLLGLLGALAAAAGGFYLTFSGRVLPVTAAPAAGPVALPDLAFVPLDPVIISLGPASRGRHLRFTSQVEVVARHRAEVDALRPRLLDVLNSYLRALEPEEIEAPGGLPRLRAQMLRRLQIVTGEGRVRDLLITEFVIN